MRQETGEGERLRDLHERVHRGSYRAQPSRRTYIPKPDGRQRPLGIAALEDKIVQHAVGVLLSAIYEEDFLDFSYGFRPGRGQHDALDSLWVGIMRKKVNWVLDADIRGFFDTLDHEWLMKFRLIPEDPHFVPDRERQAQAETLFADRIGGSDGVEVENCVEITLFDCGGNFECIRCPSCRVELPVEWWWDRVEEERAQGFPFAPRDLPCCPARKNVNELAYEWSQGFARFALSAMNRIRPMTPSGAAA